MGRENRNPGLVFKTRVSYYLNRFSTNELRVVLQIGNELLKEKIKKDNKNVEKNK